MAALLVQPIAAHLAFGTAQAPTSNIPDHLSNREFWHLVDSFSEEEGYFPSENFVSNEIAFQDVIPRLTMNAKTDGAYLGVGPDQNFTYISALHPKIAFIVDIRRQNMLQQLMYKALFELSTDRADFLSQLFSRPRPEIGDSATAKELFEAFDEVSPDSEIFQATSLSVMHHLVQTHGFTITARDEGRIRHVLRAFFIAGPRMTYYGPNRGFRRFQWAPTYSQLLTQTDGNGENRSYMASEKNFRIVQDLEKRNLIVPVVGDFAGEKAIRSVGQYLREHELSVAAFYLSNVEQYLFQGDAWIHFYRNAEALPIDDSSMMIRSVFDERAIDRWFSKNNGADSVSLVCPIQDVLSAFKGGQIQQYDDILYISQ